MRIGATAIVQATLCLALAFAATACGGGSLFRQYEYEEEVYLSLDGTAVVFVNSSIPALNALRGASFDTRPNAPVDRAAVRAYFSTPVTRVTDIGTSRRANRSFVRVRIEVDDVRRLGEAPAFAWSSYELTRAGEAYVFRQSIGRAAGSEVGNVGWTGGEIVAFRLHLPSRVTFHNTADGPLRGNILRWEQPLADRLRGAPLMRGGIALEALEARLETTSILYRTLWLFGWTLLAVAVTCALTIWLIVRRNVKTAEV
ncbi:MAG: hypothetical protein WBD07_13450 [Vicinamibacterales bacterium]